MGRKSLVEERREEILAAFERCIGRYGIDVPLERIAKEAGMQRSLIRHYIGNRDEVVEQLMARIAEAYPRQIAEAIAPEQAGQIKDVLDCLFNETIVATDWDAMIRAVVSTAQDRYPQAKQRIAQMMETISAHVARRLEELFPQAAPELCYEVAYGVLCLVQTNESMVWLGLDRRHTGLARASAEVLVGRLG